MSVTLTGAGLTVVLPSPEFGDENSIEHLRINRQTRGGDRIIFRDLNWPRIERFKLSFRQASQKQAWALLTFIEATLGQDVIMVDHNGITWNGIIVNPEMEAQQELKSISEHCGGFLLEIDFEGFRA